MIFLKRNSFSHLGRNLLGLEVELLMNNRGRGLDLTHRKAGEGSCFLCSVVKRRTWYLSAGQAHAGPELPGILLGRQPLTALEDALRGVLVQSLVDRETAGCLCQKEKRGMPGCVVSWKKEACRGGEERAMAGFRGNGLRFREIMMPNETWLGKWLCRVLFPVEGGAGTGFLRGD